jgi:SSS family solute:Na+ symporter
MNPRFTTVDWLVLVVYFCGIVGLGLFFHRRAKTTDGFTAGGRALPGWLCGLSIFATYLSSISYLALPGKSFVDNWNPFVFSLAIPPATWIASVWFLPYYRRTNEVSAYAMLEKRFGSWARIYASAFYLLFQIARMGMVMYLMALPMAVIFGWDIRFIILVTGVSVTVYALVGGIVAVIWADAIQAIVLLAGACIALAVICRGVPDGLWGVIETGLEEDKFSLGSTNLFAVSQPTIWVMMVYGLMENLKNFGIDQSYIQRYIASSSDREARRSIWIGGLLYVPVSALFFFIGTALHAFYQSHPDDLPQVRRIVAAQRLTQEGVSIPTLDRDGDQQIFDPANPSLQSAEVAEYASRVDTLASSLEVREIGDRVFPHFIAVHLAPGLTGLLIAAIFAAAMSTVSTSLNSSATLVMSDFYRRFIRPEAPDSRLMFILYAATILWGAMGTAMALILVRVTDNALDVWWTLSSVLGAGILGIFLLGLTVRRAGNRAAVSAVFASIIVIGWMILSRSDYWPAAWEAFRSPFNLLLVIVIGSLTTMLTGWLFSFVFVRRRHH